MKRGMINTTYQRLKAQSDAVIGQVMQLVQSTGNEVIIAQMSDLSGRLSDPFMFVIVGEVKSGKSSFINALLDTGKDICAVAPSPMTDTIQQIVYGEEEAVESISPYLKQIFQPIDILKEVAIVDTPGTNTIIDHHQEITERFIPASDLIVFVFEAKNPYRRSAWEFFDLIHDEWKKKVVFVLQQIDLIDEKDLQVNRRGVQDYAQKRGIEDPNIFTVSAKLEQEGVKDRSGYMELRDFIHENITGGQAPYLKLSSTLTTGRTVLGQISEAIDLREKQLAADLAFRDEIQSSLSAQAERSNRQVNLLVENLINTYEQIWNDYRRTLSDGLSIFAVIRRGIRSVFDRQANIKYWLRDLSSDLERTMQERLHHKISGDVDDLAESIQNMVKMIDLKIQNTETYFSKDVDLYRAIAERRGNILKDLRKTFGAFIEDSDNFKNDKLFPKVRDVAPGIATGSGLAVVGVILTAVTHGAVLDFTGGIMTTIGLLFAGITTGLNKRKVLRSFDEELEAGRDRLQVELGDKLQLYIEDIKSNIQSHFTRFDNYLEQEEALIQTTREKTSRSEKRIKELNVEIETELKKIKV